MKKNYRGFEIDVHREQSMGGDELLYFSIMRISDGWVIKDDFSTGSDTIKDMMKYLKNNVDNIVENPLDYFTDINDAMQIMTDYDNPVYNRK